MAEQAQTLIHVADRASVCILSFAAGAHVAMGMTYRRLSFADPELDFIYLEVDIGAFSQADAADARRYDSITARLIEHGLSRDDSRALAGYSGSTGMTERAPEGGRDKPVELAEGRP